jgi:glycosyltransferase involved in cell wall biosynthesis
MQASQTESAQLKSCHAADAPKILHVAESIKGGIATVLRSLLRHQLVGSGEGRVAAVVPSQHAGELCTIPSQALIQFQRAKRDVRSVLALSVTTQRAIVEFRPDIIHLHSSFAGAVGRSLLCAQVGRKRPKIVYTPHAFAFMMQGSKWKRTAFSILEAGLSRFADAIICGSDFEQKAALVAGVRADRLHRIYNGIALPDVAARVPTSPTAGPLKLLFVGRFDRQKGLDVLLKAMAKLPTDMFRLVVVGATVVNDDVASRPRLPNVEYVGWVPHDALAPIYADADVLVMPSRWESFGLVAAEAHGHGVPVVAARSCSLPEIVHHNRTGFLFDVDDSDELANLLRSTPRARWRELGTAGRKNVEQHFVDTNMLHQTDELYRRLLSAT